VLLCGFHRLSFVLIVSAVAGCQFDPSAERSVQQGFGADLDAGTIPLTVHKDCLEILSSGRSAGDGSYTIDPDGEGGEPSFEAYCDMTTDGGGWTLVYAYAFTDYGNFRSGANAITPRPSWTFTDSGPSVPLSTTPPTGPQDQGALEFSRWSELGSSFLVQSNINHWLICNEGSGSLVNEVEGSIDCRIEKEVGTACTTEVPTTIHPFWAGSGPTINGGGHYYYWEGTTNNSWPTHDPCGKNQENHLSGVESPGGAIFLRSKS